MATDPVKAALAMSLNLKEGEIARKLDWVEHRAKNIGDYLCELESEAKLARELFHECQLLRRELDRKNCGGG